MKIIADRIEGDFIVAEMPDGSFANLPRVFAPGAKEGDFINIETDENLTEIKNNEIKSRLEGLFEE